MLASQAQARGMSIPGAAAVSAGMGSHITMADGTRVPPCRGCRPGGLGRRPVMVAATAGGPRLRRPGGALSTALGGTVNWDALFWQGVLDPDVQFPLDDDDAGVVHDDDPGWLGIDWGSVGDWANNFADTISDPLQSWFAWRNSIEQRGILDQRRAAAGNARANTMAWVLPVALVGGGAILVFALRRKAA